MMAMKALAAYWLLILGVKGDDLPATDRFYRRYGLRIAVIDNYLYIDGGEISSADHAVDHHSTDPANSTISVDLSTSWNLRDATFNQVQKPFMATIMLHEAIMQKQGSKSFYVWGGQMSWKFDQDQIPDPQLWRFDTDGSGGGSWSTETPRNPDDFAKLNRTEGAAYVSTADSGFVIGGQYTFRSTRTSTEGDFKGLVRFNFSESTTGWDQHTENPYSPDDTIYGASATYIPNFGRNGLVMLLGGMMRQNQQGSRGLAQFDEVYFFDPVTMEWYSQKTTGALPGPRYFHCSVGITGDDNTFEIFMYGGSNPIAERDFDEVWILSLPGFVWKRANYDPADPRMDQVCAVVGNRQMISVGGIRFYNKDVANYDYFTDPDNHPNGLGIFDMTTLSWKDNYDANADVYQTPEDIKSWYANQGMDSVNWTSAKVEAIFKSKEANNDNGKYKDKDNGNETKKGNNTSPDEKHEGAGDDANIKKTPSLNTSAIVGIVVGGVAALGVIGIALWFFLLRRSNGNRRNQTPRVNAEAAENESSGSLTNYSSLFELAVHPMELMGSEVRKKHDSSSLD